MVSKEVAMKTIPAASGLEDLDEKATQTEQSLVCLKVVLSLDNSPDLFPASHAQIAAGLPCLHGDAGETSSFQGAAV